MKLNQGEVNKNYLVKQVMAEDTIARRLEALGVNEQTKITILHKKRGKAALVIKVRGTRLALGGGIAEGIEVEEVKLYGAGA